MSLLLGAYPPDVKRLVQTTRRWVKATLPAVSENVATAARLISYSYGPGYRGAVCTLILSQKGVKLGLVGGASLGDPHGLLAGNGKRHRHVPIQVAEDLEQAGLRQLLLDARAACIERLRT